jgi:hypothetical protein
MPDRVLRSSHTTGATASAIDASAFAVHSRISWCLSMAEQLSNRLCPVVGWNFDGKMYQLTFGGSLSQGGDRLVAPQCKAARSNRSHPASHPSAVSNSVRSTSPASPTSAVLSGLLVVPP